MDVKEGSNVGKTVGAVGSELGLKTHEKKGVDEEGPHSDDAHCPQP